MSLIENALAKLRRGREAQADMAVSGARGVRGEASASKPAPRAVVAEATAPAAPARVERDYKLKHISIDRQALRSAGYLPDEGLERRFADHFRHIKRPLIDKALSGSPEMRLILVSSALPGDGKTFTSINLALSMARERDTSVLLVDADAARPRIGEVLGLHAERGLLDALGDESLDVEALIVQTDVPGLEILPAGKFVESAHELIASTRMERIVARLGARNARQLVVFDSAPLLASSETRALLRALGQAVLVVRVGATPCSAVKEAVGHVDKKKLQGLIVNHAALSSVGGYYGYANHGETRDDIQAY